MKKRDAVLERHSNVNRIVACIYPGAMLMQNHLASGPEVQTVEWVKLNMLIALVLTFPNIMLLIRSILRGELYVSSGRHIFNTAISFGFSFIFICQYLLLSLFGIYVIG